jgi:hypothetical protein
MQLKAALLAVAATASAVSASPFGGDANQVNVHRQFQVEDQICVTKHEVTFCDHGFKPIYDENSERFVEMYCLDKRHPKAHNMAKAMQNGNSLKQMHSDFQTRRIQLPKVTRCESIKLTKNGQVEDYTTEQEQRNGLRPKFQTGKHQQKFQTKQEREQQYQKVQSQQRENLKQLKELMPTIEQAVQLSESDYQNAFELIKKIVRNDEHVQGALYELQNTLPEAYADAVQRVQDELIQESMNEEEQKQVKEQLKKLASRVYIYTLTRLANEEQKKSIHEQIETEYNNWQLFEKQFERVWEQFKREMDSDKTQSIERQVEREFQQQIQEDEQTQLQSWQLSLQQTEEQEKKNNQNNKEQEQEQPRQWQQEMSRQQRERNQMQLTKIIMAGLKTAEKQQKDQPRSSGFANMFSKKTDYSQLTQQSRRQFQNNNY